jgi:hypothetical protein
MRIKHVVSAILIFAAVFMMSAATDGRSFLHSTKSLEPNIAAQSSQSPTLQRWEYRPVTASVGGLLGDRKGIVERELNQLGMQGFEINSMTQSSADVGFHLTIVLRRPEQ